MSIHTPVQHTAEELMIIEAFEHPHKVKDVFTVHEFPQSVRETFLNLVEQGRSLLDLENDYLALRGRDYPSVVSDSDITKGWTKARYVAFVAGMKSLLGTPEHSALAVDYLLNNLRNFRAMTKDGTFDGGKDTFELIMSVSDSHPVPNLCRDQEDKIRDEKVINSLIYSKSDCYAFLMSAIANRDSESVKRLIDCHQFSRDLSHANVLGVVRDQIKAYPGRGLEAAFGHFLDQKNNAMFIANMKSLCSSTTSTKQDFLRSFWLGADRFVIHQQVAEAVRFSHDRNPQLSILLEVLRENNVDLLPGLIIQAEGIGAYFDSFNEPRDLEAGHKYIIEFVSDRIIRKHRQDLSVLLVDIPIETLKVHPLAEMLLKHLYLGTRDKAVLNAIEDKQFRGEMLEDSMGL
jgi:hypothetical protein